MHSVSLTTVMMLQSFIQGMSTREMYTKWQFEGSASLWNILYTRQEDVLIEVGTTWPLLLPRLAHKHTCTHTPHAARQRTDSYFECQTLQDTHIITAGFFVKFVKKWVIEDAHCVCYPPTCVRFELCCAIDQTSFHVSSLLLSPIKKKGTGGCVKTILFNIMEILFWWAAIGGGKAYFCLPLTTHWP